MNQPSVYIYNGNILFPQVLNYSFSESKCLKIEYFLDYFYKLIKIQNNACLINIKHHDYTELNLFWFFFTSKQIFSNYLNVETENHIHYTYHKDLLDSILKCKKNKDIRFIIIPIANIFGDFNHNNGTHYNSIGHFNVLIIDKLKKIIQYLDPAGSSQEVYLNDRFDKKVNVENAIMTVFNKIFLHYKIFNNYIYINFNKTLDQLKIINPQYLSENSKLYFQLNRKDIGFCVSWILLHIDLILHNQDKDLKDLQNHYLSTSENNLTNYILKYTKMIEEKSKNHTYKIINKTIFDEKIITEKIHIDKIKKVEKLFDLL